MLEYEMIKHSRLKMYMRRKMKGVVIQFRKEEKLDVLQLFLKYVHNFLILDADELQPNSKIPMVRTRCSVSNLEDVLTKISSDRYDLIEDIDLTEQTEEYQYLLFCKEVGKTLQNELETDLNEQGWADYRFKMLKYLVAKYTIYTTYYFDRYLVIEMTRHGSMSDEPIRVYENKVLMPPCYILTTLGGIGDSFILFSILHEFVLRKKNEGYDIYLSIASVNEKYNGHDTFFFGQYPRLLFDSAEMRDFYKLREVPNLIDLNHCFSKCIKPSHISDLVKDIAGIEREFNPYTHNTLLKKMLSEQVSSEEMKYIDELTGKNNVIGLQYFTGQIIEGERQYVTNSKRNWPLEHVIRFIELCKEHGIEVLALNPNPYSTELGAKQLGSMSLQAYAITISKLPLLVGIDSSGGHIASFFNIPSITIWGEQSPIDAFSKDVSYRALRNNYSLWSRDKKISSIKPELVFEKVQEFMKGELRLKEDIITYEESVNQQYMHILEE